MTTKIRDCLDAAKVAVDGLHKRMDALEKSALATPTGNLGEGGQFNLHPRRGPWPSKKDAAKMPGGLKETAYRGYLIRELRSGEYVISKDGHHISYANSAESAKKTIDQLI